MKGIKHFLFITVMAFLVFIMVGCGKAPTITLNEKAVEVTVGETHEITYTIKGKKDAKVTFEVANKELISIDGATIKALKEGTTEVKVSLVDYPESFEILTVKVNPVPGAEIEGPDAMFVNDEATLKAIAHGIEGDIVWRVSDKKIATITTEGVIKAKSTGTVKVTLYYGAYMATKEIVITNRPRVILTGDREVVEGKSVELKGILQFAEGELTWESSDKEIAKVENGVVTGLKPGKVTIKASFKEYFSEHNMTVLPKPTIEIKGALEAREYSSATLSASLKDYEGTFAWESSNKEVATVDDKGNIQTFKPGTTNITVTAGEEVKTFEFVVKGMDKKIVYDFDGGVSEELYATGIASGALTLNNYNTASGSFWGGGYTSYVYITDQDNDPTATFSDRFYIGKNQYTGFYEVKSILLTGGSEWPTGAEYVISISNSHDSYWSIHNKVRDVQVGDVVFIEKEINTINKDNVSKCMFYKPEIDKNILLLSPEQYTGALVNPVKLGCNFLGWYDEQDQKVESITTVDKAYVLKAKWELNNPVLDIIHTEIPSEMYTNDTLKVDAKVSPNNAFFQEIIFATSDTDVIQITEDGLITCINSGKATITIRDYASQVVKTIEINVLIIPSIDVKFDHYFDGVLDINETIALNPTFVGRAPDNLKYTYTTSDDKVLSVDESGTVKALKNGTAEITIKTSDNKYSLVVGLTVNGKSNATKADELITLLQENNFATVETGNMSLYNDEIDRYYKATYGSVNRFLFDDLVINTDYVNTAVNNPRCHKDRRSADTIEFVTVHDTATLTASPQGIAANMSSNETSIHYTVGDRLVYQVVPEKYIAYHAGDGTHYTFSWKDSKVEAKDDKKPEFDLYEKNNKYYLKLNGIETRVEVPVEGYKNDVLTKLHNPDKSYFCDLKPVYTVKSGRYFIGPMWVCYGQTARGAICSQGGNNNSIGIEMCVNTDGDMYDTLQRTAMLVSDILIRNKLGFERVQKHNSWSGKNCPQVERSADYWDDFMMMVKLQHKIRSEYNGCKISMKSNNPEIVDNTGKVIKAPLTTTTVSYEVTVTCGSTTRSITLYSIVPGTSMWQQWNGVYPASRIWNNGYFVR